MIEHTFSKDARPTFINTVTHPLYVYWSGVCVVGEGEGDL